MKSYSVVYRIEGEAWAPNVSASSKEEAIKLAKFILQDGSVSDSPDWLHYNVELIDVEQEED